MDHIQRLCPSIVGLVETKVKLSDLHKIKKCVPQNWISCNNFHLSTIGRISISWNLAIWACAVLSISMQQITISMKNNGGMEGFLSVVYGLNTQGGREELSKDLIGLQIHSSPWLVTGDCNIARYTDEKFRGKPLTFNQLSFFNDFITRCSLSDLRSVGSYWSWSNKSLGIGRIVGKLDRTLCNSHWLDLLCPIMNTCLILQVITHPCILV